MTKKFFNDWSNNRSLTTKIELQNYAYSFERNGKIYYVYNNDLNVNTLTFEGEYISIVVNAHWIYINNSGYLDKSKYGNETIRIKIHRKYIKTVHFT